MAEQAKNTFKQIENLCQAEAERTQSWKIGEARPMSEGYLEARGHWEVTRYPAALGDQSSTSGQIERGVHQNLRSELRHRTACPANLFNSTMSRSRIQSPSKQVHGQDEFYDSDFHQCHTEHHFVRKRFWGLQEQQQAAHKLNQK